MITKASSQNPKNKCQNIDMRFNKAKSLLDAKFKGLYVPLFIKMFIHLS